MKKEFTLIREKGFTLIEMVVTIAVIAIVSAAIIVGIAPAQRIADAQNSRAKQDVRGVASAIEACLSYTDIDGNSPTAAFCGTSASLTSSNSGGPFARAIPTAVTVASSGSTVCVTEVGATGTTWKYTTATGQVLTGTGCP